MHKKSILKTLYKFTINDLRKRVISLDTLVRTFTIISIIFDIITNIIAWIIYKRIKNKIKSLRSDVRWFKGYIKFFDLNPDILLKKK